jgi:hypothetical protein
MGDAAMTESDVVYRWMTQADLDAMLEQAREEGRAEIKAKADFIMDRAWNHIEDLAEVICREQEAEPCECEEKYPECVLCEITVFRRRASKILFPGPKRMELGKTGFVYNPPDKDNQ